MLVKRTDCVDSWSILPEKESTTKEKSVHDSFVAQDSSERSPEAQTHCSFLVLNANIDGWNFLLHINVIDGKFADVCKILESVLALALGKQPAGGFLDEKGSNEEQHCGWNLDNEWNQPLNVGWRHCSADSVVDPETYKSAYLPAKFVESNESATNSRRWNFRNVDWSQVGSSTNSNAG